MNICVYTLYTVEHTLFILYRCLSVPPLHLQIEIDRARVQRGYVNKCGLLATTHQIESQFVWYLSIYIIYECAFTFTHSTHEMPASTIFYFSAFVHFYSLSLSLSLFHSTSRINPIADVTVDAVAIHPATAHAVTPIQFSHLIELYKCTSAQIQWHSERANKKRKRSTHKRTYECMNEISINLYELHVWHILSVT